MTHHDHNQPHPRPLRLSKGGDARGGGPILDRTTGLDACFDRKSPHYNFTKQCEYEVRFGANAADAARRKSGGGR